MTQMHGLVAYNGILCGDSRFFSLSDYWEYTVVLLHDKYRPKVDVARQGIRELSLESSTRSGFI